MVEWLDFEGIVFPKNVIEKTEAKKKSVTMYLDMKKNKCIQFIYHTINLKIISNCYCKKWRQFSIDSWINFDRFMYTKAKRNKKNYV